MERSAISNQQSAKAGRVFLMGYRGCGKSTVGQLLAEHLGWEAIDTDDLAEAEAGKSIASIFESDGEPAFRDLEETVISNVCERREVVVSLGGGAVLREATRQRLKDAGPVVWLTASAEILAARIESDMASSARRPSLTGLSGLDEVRRVLAEREPIYGECATVAIDADGRSPDAIAAEIAGWLDS